MNIARKALALLLALALPYAGWIGIWLSPAGWLHSQRNSSFNYYCAKKPVQMPPLCGRPNAAAAGRPPPIRPDPAWPLRALELPPWKEIRTPRARVESDLPAGELRRRAAVLQAILDQLACHGLARGDPVSIRIYRTQEQLRAHGRRFDLPPVGGLYDPQLRKVVLCADGMTIRLAAHELAHALLDEPGRPPPAPWIAEGAAECAAARVEAAWGLGTDLPIRDPPDIRGLSYAEWNRGDAETRRWRYEWARAWFEREMCGDIAQTYRRLAGWPIHNREERAP
jgi:hypothetical protein